MDKEITTKVPGLEKRLRDARVAAGLSQGQVANILNMHRPAVTDIETGDRKVTAGELKAFAGLYKVSIEWLLGEPSPSAALKMAARKLSSLKDKDFESVMRIIDSLHRSGSSKK